MMVDKQTVEGRMVDEIHYLVDMNDNEEAEVRLINYAKDDSKRKVIEELNSIANFCQGATEEMIYESVTKRIKQLKQD
jgi:hypothetical protein